ncbi:MAG: prepilin-type N-terminal cleavage/methylation domain-containing protein, partial [Elusimicrobium sp.]|nr:prepilin-type N-terminal cleavage/methylation domain-containing protein [Elusimicrobium sp.]
MCIFSKNSTFKKNGFTLIELLVTVLIIGILAAVALPQYNKTVGKARAAEGLAKINTLYQALEIYRLSYGSYPNLGTASPTQDQMNQALDIDVNLGRDFTFTYYNGIYVAIHYLPFQFFIAKGLSETSGLLYQQKGVTT